MAQTDQLRDEAKGPREERKQQKNHKTKGRGGIGKH